MIEAFPKPLPRRLKTGTQVWNYTLPGFDQVCISPVISGDQIFAVSDFGSVTALKTSSGALVWSEGTGSGYNPVVSNGLLFLNDHFAGTLSALDPGTGVTKWTYPYGTPSFASTPAVAGGRVFFTAFNTVYAVSVASGTLLWSQPLTGSAPCVCSKELSLANGKIYVAANDSVMALRESDGLIQWHYVLPSGLRAISHPAIANCVVYISLYNGGSNGWVYAFTAKTGTLRWAEQVGPVITDLGIGENSAVAVANGVLYVPDEKQRLRDRCHHQLATSYVRCRHRCRRFAQVAGHC